MKQKLFFLSFLCLSIPSLAQNAWVSDEIEAPLRSAPELNSKIVALLPAGLGVSIVDTKKDYVKVKTVQGEEGWLSNYYVLKEKSVHAKLAPTEKALRKAQTDVEQLKTSIQAKDEEISQLKSRISTTQSNADELAKRAQDGEAGINNLQSNNDLLKKELSEQSEKVEKLVAALDAAKKKATDANSRYLSLAKVSQNAVEIDEQNQRLQERVVKFEQEVQQLKTENLTLRSKNDNKGFLIGVMTVLGGILVGYVLSVMMPPRSRAGGGGRYSSL